MVNEYWGWGNQIILGVDKDGACALNSICFNCSFASESFYSLCGEKDLCEVLKINSEFFGP